MVDNFSQKVRADFPFFDSERKGAATKAYRQLPAYLDSAATTQKPRAVIDRLSAFYSEENANIHRGAYHYSGVATDNYERVRVEVGAFLNTPANGVVFTRGTTDGLNMLAYALESRVSPGDKILLTLLEHHSNIVPWQLLASRRKAELHFAEIDQHGQLLLSDFEAKLNTLKPKIVSFTAVSNALGTVLPVAKLCALARSVGAITIVDGAQSVAHSCLDLGRMGCDFLVFSGHKIYGPTGVGALCGRPEILSTLEPVQGGGGMIASVTTTGSTWAESPQRFEAGTPPIAEVLGLGAAIAYLNSIGLESVISHENQLFAKAFEVLKNEPGVTVYGPANVSAAQHSIISFNLKGIHPHDFATIADSFNVQLRAGHHCAMPLMRRLGLQSTARISLGAYSTESDISALCEAIRFAFKKFR